ncbi:transcriptional regulator GutM [Chthonobacter albigriseus]|uniref:transcriptional regulator GutM n=1 Tax=Chthonobacter albigriseus TaxID=1683161 RepID=UPI0015EEA966|nr:transcriptional regulator GutM [Chthonobacter albigriseus]
MEWWQTALLLLALVWALQAFGTWFQMKHYRDVMRGIASQWADGFVGAGNARGALGKGVILLVVVTPDDIVRKLLVMEGRSVFAKFRVLPEYEGMTLERLSSGAFGRKEKGRAEALAKAVEQIRKAQGRAEAPNGQAAQTA